MFSVGQLYFALFFVVAFTGIIIWSYKGDKKQNRNYFKGSYKIVLVFFGLLLLLFLIKTLTQTEA